MLLFILLIPHIPERGYAQALSTRTYSAADGLTNQVVTEIRQDPTGYLYLVTGHGVFVYDGKGFANLGRPQGLPSGGFVQNIVFDGQGRIIIGYPHQIFISDTATSPRHSPTTLKFHAIVDIDENHDGDGVYGMAVRANEAVVKYRGHLALLPLDNIRGGPLKEHPFYNALDRFAGVVAVLAHGNTLWVAYRDGAVRTEQDGTVTTVLSSGELGEEPFQEWSFDKKGRVYAVSARLLVVFEGNRVQSVETLPIVEQDDAEAYFKHSWVLCDGSGMLVIWTGNRLYQHRPGRDWQVIQLAPSRSRGASAGFIDVSGALWLGSAGEEGVRRVVGWGMWQSFEDADVLAGAGDIWSLLPYGKERVLAMADHGMFVLGGKNDVRKIDGQDSYAGKIDGKGHVWRSSEKNGVERLTLGPAGNIVERRRFDIMRVNDLAIQRIPGKGEALWIAAEEGLYRLPVDARDRQTPEKIVSGEFQMPAKISSIAFGGQGEVWFLADGKLFCRDPGGRIVAVENRWAIRNFLPFSLLFRTDGELWVGGVGGGIFRVFVDGSRVRKIVHVNVPDILSDSVSSLALDEQKRVWVGTDRGVSVYDGARWVSANDNDGLLWNDLNQNGLTSTPDGTIWISTSRGVSHLLKPDLLFAPRDLRPVFSDVRLGDKALPERAVPYGKQLLTVRFGLLNFSAQENVQFRYRLEGVDADWAYTTTGEVRYASVPSGHHKLVLQAIDTLRHEVSPPVSVLIRMKRPWWVAWPLLVLYVAVVVTSIYAFVRARTRRLLRRQHELEQIVAERTFEMQRAQRALEEQARQDGLTKLLNRRTIEASILRVLEECQPGASTNVVTVALIDVDHFKSINDRFGHMVGDEVLIEIGARFLQMRRPGELFGRFGGEEFLVAVEGADEGASRRVCDIAVEITEAPFRTRLGEMSVTISAGVAQCRTGESLDELIERADRALYRAKADGRDRIVFSGKDLENEAYRG